VFFQLLGLIKKKLVTFIIGAMILGLIVGSLVDVSRLKELILPLTFLLVYPMVVPLNFASLKERESHKLQAVVQMLNFIVFPLIAFVLGRLFFESVYLRLGLLLIALLPTSGMSISWTVMAKGNVNAVIRMVVIGLILGALLSPLYITVLLGAEVDVPVFQIFTQILVVVFVPLLAAYITQKLLLKRYGKEKFHQSIKQKFPPFSTLGVVMIIFVAVALRAKVLINNPSILLEIVVPLLLFYLLVGGSSIFVGRVFFTRRDAVALVNGTLIRNLSLSLAIVLSAFPEASIAAVLIAMSYVLQVQIAAWNVRLTNIIFPEKPELVNK
jgi:ACR3 family arsenite efflux pump ArsB